MRKSSFCSLLSQTFAYFNKTRASRGLSNNFVGKKKHAFAGRTKHILIVRSFLNEIKFLTSITLIEKKQMRDKCRLHETELKFERLQGRERQSAYFVLVTRTIHQCGLHPVHVLEHVRKSFNEASWWSFLVEIIMHFFIGHC